jgi:hypothetical protein
MDHWKWQLNSDWLDLNLILFEGTNKMTPAEIAKLTEQAKRASTLMRRSSTSGNRAQTVFDNYEKALAAFEANVELTDKNTAALNAAMAAMGNAGPILDAAFQDEESDNPVSAQPSEGAGLPKVNGG